MFTLSKNNFKKKNIDIEKTKKNVNVKYIKNPKIFISLCFILFFNIIKRIKIKFIFNLYIIYLFYKPFNDKLFKCFFLDISILNFNFGF